MEPQILINNNELFDNADKQIINNIKKVIVDKKYINKQGIETIYHYDQKKYNDTYYKINKTKILSNIYTCPSCNIAINLLNKSNHNKTLKHKLNNDLYQINKNK